MYNISFTVKNIKLCFDKLPKIWDLRNVLCHATFIQFIRPDSADSLVPMHSWLANQMHIRPWSLINIHTEVFQPVFGTQHCSHIL